MTVEESVAITVEEPVAITVNQTPAGERISISPVLAARALSSSACVLTTAVEFVLM